MVRDRMILEVLYELSTKLDKRVDNGFGICNNNLINVVQIAIGLRSYFIFLSKRLR